MKKDLEELGGKVGPGERRAQVISRLEDVRGIWGCVWCLLGVLLWV